jgi:hypothetical protein
VAATDSVPQKQDMGQCEVSAQIAMMQALAACDLDFWAREDVAQLAETMLPQIRALLDISGKARAHTGPSRFATYSTPEDWTKLTRSTTWSRIATAMKSYVDANRETARPDQAGKGRKSLATVIEKEVRGHIEAEMSKSVGGNAGLGLDLPYLGVDIKATMPSQPQGSASVSGSDLVLGLGYHLIVVIYTFDDGILRVEGWQFFPKWKTADHRASQAAEKLRRHVVAGQLAVEDALGALLEEHGVHAAPELVDALTSSQTIPVGLLTVTPMSQARISFRKESLGMLRDTVNGRSAL